MKSIISQLNEMCIDVFAHSENQYDEVTISGNGIDSSEASLMALGILDILYGDGREWRKQNKKKISTRAKELRIDYGDE